MAAMFEPAVAVVITHEGGYCNFANDPGGATNWGISKVIRANCKLTPHDLGIPDFSDDSIKSMPRRAAERVYFLHWWVPWRLWEINDQTIATKIMDYGINSSPPRVAIVFAQQVCRDLGRDLTVDGKIGPLTIAAINACDRGDWLRAYAAMMWGRWSAILRLHPEMEIPWRRVWSIRAAWGVPALEATPPILGDP
ncbi:MAG: hypothetical protein A2W26_02435 [Acidobacteria bacterium RBG_16_64_8]|nr:MAG: hypothetical protein A2W26_02435 [Acidobacteria bacterium RBG_16_64_8]